MRQAAFLFTLLPIVLPTVVAQRPGQPARSWLHGAVLDRSPLVVRAQLDSDEVLPLHEIQVTRFKVLETLKGRRRKHVLVGAAGERGGAFKDLDKVLFLKPLKSGSLHELIDIIDLTSRDSETVPATLRAYFRIAREARPAPRNRALFDLSMSNVGRQSIFATRVAFNELLRLADQAPHLFKPQHLEQLERSGATAPRVSR
ncbi:MAG: hypothetical protein HRU14_15665, partial [Planctomycetes bacterium]|nr:hypothetical protein [Planctomycetota bacterium]